MYKKKEQGDQYNILFIVVDGLRTQLHSYGDQNISSPNIDKLASDGMLFKRAYCQIASCDPSRASVMTSRYPDITQVFDNSEKFRDALPNVITLPQNFKQNGYITKSFGKVVHLSFKEDTLADLASWSTSPWRPPVIQYQTQGGLIDVKYHYFNYIKKWGSIWKAMDMRRLKGLAWESPDRPDSDFTDGKTTEKVLNVLPKLKNKDEPFFLAVGFMKPHLPFSVPQKYFDIYKKRKSRLRVYANGHLPKEAPRYSNNNSSELRGYDFVPKKGPIPPELARQLTIGYDASVSFIDAQIGRIMNELERLGLRKNTIVVFWSDHGQQVGQLGLWAKNTLFENDLRVPLIISAPGHSYVKKRSEAIVEYVDIYPTLCELAGIPIPKGVQGKSLVPLLKGHPKNYHAKFAFSQSPWPWFGKNARAYMGYSIRTKKYRYTEWIPRDSSKKTYKALYRYKGNINKDSLLESSNLVSAEKYSKTVKRLSKMLHKKRRKILREK